MSLNELNLAQEDKAGRLEIVYYTDPLCCWSWAFEPQWRRLLFEFKGKVGWRYCMGGLIPDWKSFNDPMNSIHRPSQMGPLWMETKHISGMPIDDTIWIENAPVSSYPACIAVKAAEIQSLKAGEEMLRALREAVMMHKQNISNQQVLLDIGESLSIKKPQLFDIDKFEHDLLGEEASNAFSEDLQQIRINKIGRFPTLTLSNPDGKAIILTGYRPYPVLLQAVENVFPELLQQRIPIIQDEYIKYWDDKLTEREIAEIIDPVQTESKVES